jgi:hypothetical protein
LFAVACSRTVWAEIDDRRLEPCFDLAERFADGKATNEDLDNASHHFCKGSHERIVGDWELAAILLLDPIEPAEEICRLAKTRLGTPALLRCVFGNPFRSVTMNLASRTVNVAALAQSLYDDRAFDRLPILADALEDAGCDNADILNHCRQPGEHVRGCWVVDLLLGKE